MPDRVAFSQSLSDSELKRFSAASDPLEFQHRVRQRRGCSFLEADITIARFSPHAGRGVALSCKAFDVFGPNGRVI